MDQFKQTYFEECEDRIGDAEEALSEMQSGSDDPDTINRVFRAVHSIKGGAGAFGFTQIVNFTHHFETVMDKVRTGEITPQRELIDVFLRANDIVQSMISKEQSGEEIPAEYGQEILDELIKISGEESEDTNSTPPSPSAEEETSTQRTWAITFRPEEDVLKSGNEPLFIIRALQDLGELKVTAEIDNIPSINEIIADQCYISWRLLLKTNQEKEEIEEIFDFVEDMCDLKIELQNVPTGDLPERRKADRNPEKSAQFGRRKEDKELNENNVLGNASIRVNLGRIDQLVNLVGEMVIAQSMLQEQVRWLPPEMAGKVGEGVESLTRHMRDLQESVMSVRAQQIKSVFTRMPRIIREVSDMCGKDVRLTTFGEDTEVDKTVLENLVDPLTHMIRNSVDHGIEPPEEREAAGKNRYGMIQLSAKHKSGRIVIEIQDDGKGISRDAVLNKAVRQNLVPKDAVLSDQEIDNLIFKPGFSTAAQVSEVSGRGVGMDVVKRNVANMGGRISVSNRPGKGCTMTLSLPLTLAVMDGMVVSVGSQRFVLPTINIIESFQPKKENIGTVSTGCNVVMARGQYVHLIPLFNLFGITDSITDPQEALIILLESDEGGRIALMIDDVLGQQQVVIKSLETNYSNVDGISAATILGNGDVALIIDVPGMIHMRANIDLRDECISKLSRSEKFAKQTEEIDAQSSDPLTQGAIE
jgi:two-component system chemotaxis sensor kinase CheA